MRKPTGFRAALAAFAAAVLALAIALVAPAAALAAGSGTESDPYVVADDLTGTIADGTIAYFAYTPSASGCYKVTFLIDDIAYTESYDSETEMWETSFNWGYVGDNLDGFSTFESYTMIEEDPDGEYYSTIAKNPYFILTLEAGETYVLTLENNTGEDLTVTGVSAEVVKEIEVDLSQTTYVLDEDGITLDDILANLSVTYDGEELVLDEDYIIGYSDEFPITSPGTVYLMVRGGGLYGIGDYYGGTGLIEITVTLPSVYRLYNPYTGEHLYTTDANEYAVLATLGWQQEGVAWLAAASGTAVYRLYNPYTGDHHYTTDLNEYSVLAGLGWQQEGVAFYSADSEDEGAVAVCRLYNPYAEAFYHLFTTDTNEYSVLAGLGWQQEGVAFYGIDPEWYETE